MKVYKVLTGYGDYQNHCVVCDNLAEVEKLFKEEYPNTTIKGVELWSEYVIVKKDTP
jgi:hypothetical protein